MHLICVKSLDYLTAEMSDWLPSLNALRAFEALTRHLSYRSAAEELNVTPAAVKQLVMKLEVAMGAPLVERRGRGLALTAHGQAGRDDLGAAMSHLATAVRKMRGQRRERRLIVTVEASFASTWLAQRLAGFHAIHPEISVLVDSSPKIVDLASSEADIAIRYGVMPDPNLVVRRIFDDRVFPACSPALADGPPKLRRLKDLGAVTLIHFDTRDQPWATVTQRWFSWKNWLAEVGAAPLRVESGLHFNDYGQAIQAAIAGQGVVLASEPILRDQIAAGLLVQPFAEEIAPGIGYNIVTTSQSAARSEVSAFIAWILAEIRAGE